MTKIAKIIVFTAAFLCSVTLYSQPRGYVISPRNAESVVSEKYVRGVIDYLCSEQLGGRACGSPGAQKSALWIGEQFREAGLDCIGGAYTHGFPVGNGLGRNVLGTIPGTGSGYIIVTAHYDNLGLLDGKLYPGADSNASGVAALLQIARMFVKMKKCGRRFGCSIVFAALDGKESDLAGSRDLWNRICNGKLGFSQQDISLVVNLDQLGSTLSPITKGNPEYLIMLSTENGRRQALENAAAAQRIKMELAYDYYGSRDFTNLFYRRVSDQRVFLENGITSVMFTSGITMLNNKPTDTPDTLDYPVLMRRIRLIYYYLARIA